MKSENTYQQLNDEQIIKVLKCCILDDINACEECPIDKSIKDDCACCKYMAEGALNLINELAAENEELKRKLDEKGVYHGKF